MRKAAIFLLSIGVIFCLLACQKRQDEVLFDDNSFNTFTYQGREYLVTEETISEQSLTSSEVAFWKLKFVDTGQEKVSIAYNGLMWDDHHQLVIGIQDNYYLVVEKSQANGTTTLYQPTMSLDNAIQLY
ncbi:NisI/SpaI family lantibiotic immunity lipoprotein [Streptococcus fryi]